MMRAVLAEEWTVDRALPVREIPEPEVGAHLLKVRVRSAACSFSDILMTSGTYQIKPPLPFVPGSEFAGEVVEIGEGVTGFSVGDEVFGFSGLGAFAEYSLAPPSYTYPIPAGMTFEEASVFSISYTTSYAGLRLRARLEPGEFLLVHGAAGGIGLAAVQMGKAIGARVIATASRHEKLAVAKDAGADLVINYLEEDFVDAVKDFTQGKGVDVVYDPVGGRITDRSLKCIAWNGRLVIVGFASGEVPFLKANRVLLKNISIVGFDWSSYAFNRPEVFPDVFAAVLDFYHKQGIRPRIGGTYRLEEVGEAFEAIRSRRACGKLVLVP